MIALRSIHRPIAIAILLLLTGYTAFAQAPAVPSPPAAASPNALSQDIRDIRGPKPITPLWLLPLIVIGGLVAAGGGYFAWTWLRRRQGAPKSPHEIALERLDAARALMPAGGRQFATEVSSTVREYIEVRFQLLAAHRTTDEFLHDALDTVDSTLAGNQSLLAEFLQSCDLAKFGGWNLTTDAMEAMLQSARRFVVQSAQPPLAKRLDAKLDTATSRETYDSLPTT
jgi:hypothetical protein